MNDCNLGSVWALHTRLKCLCYTCVGQYSILDTGVLGWWQATYCILVVQSQMIQSEYLPWDGLYVCMSSRQPCEVDTVTVPLYLRRNQSTERCRHLPKVTQGTGQAETCYHLSLQRGAGKSHTWLNPSSVVVAVEGHLFIPAMRAHGRGAPAVRPASF